MPKINIKNFAKIFFYLLSASIIPSTALAQWNVAPIPNSGLPDADLPQVVGNITNWVLGFVTVVAVLALVWGGILYITAAGNENQIEDAKNVIKYAISGLVVVGISYAVVSVIVTCWIGGTGC